MTQRKRKPPLQTGQSLRAELRQIDKVYEERRQAIEARRIEQQDDWITMGDAGFVLGVAMLGGYSIGFTQRLPFSELIPLALGTCGFFLAFGMAVAHKPGYLRLFLGKQPKSSTETKARAIVACVYGVLGLTCFIAMTG